MEMNIASFLLYTPNFFVNINKCLAITQAHDYLRQRNAPYLLRLGVYLFQVHIVSTLIHILLGGSPFWLHSDSLVTTLWVWVIYSIFPRLVSAIIHNPVFNIIHVLLMTTLATNDITQIYELPMYPDIPMRFGSYITPLLPSTLFGSLAITLVSALSGEFVKTCIIKFFIPNEKTALSSPSLQFITIGTLSILYHFFCNPHADKIASPLVNQFIPLELARIIIYIVYAIVSFFPILLKLNTSNNHDKIYNNTSKKM